MLNRTDFGDSASFAQAMHAGGYDIHDRWGRQRYAVGNDDLGRALLASVPAREQRPTPVSEYLTTKEFWKRYQSVAAANFTGVVLGWMLTVSWGSVGLADGRAWKAHQAFMELMRKWHQERGLPNAWIWVRENGSKLGDHSHILLSLERWHEADFIRWANGAVATITGSPPMAKSKDQRIQTVHLSAGHTLRFADIDAQWKLFQYICKGLNPRESTTVWDHDKGNILARHLINRHCQKQGMITGLRSGSARAFNTKRIAEIVAHPDWPLSMTEGGVPFYDDRYLAAGRLEKGLAALKI
jgi:hypothetical protein